MKGVATEELEGAVARFLPSSVQIRVSTVAIHIEVEFPQDCRPCDREDKLRPGMLGGNRFRIRVSWRVFSGPVSRMFSL